MLGCLSPVLHRLGPLLPDSRKCEIDKLFKGGIRCKYALVLGYLAELAVIAFYGICSVYYPSDMLRVLEVGGQTIPVVTPAFDDNRIVLAPFDFKIVESLFGRILINGPVYEFQIPHELFLPLAGHILDRVAYLVYNAELNRSLRKDTCNRIWKSLEPVNTGDEDILDSSVLEIRKDAEPEVGPLALGYVHAQKFLPAFLN